MLVEQVHQRQHRRDGNQGAHDGDAGIDARGEEGDDKAGHREERAHAGRPDGDPPHLPVLPLEIRARGPEDQRRQAQPHEDLQGREPLQPGGEGAARPDAVGQKQPALGGQSQQEHIIHAVQGPVLRSLPFHVLLADGFFSCR